MMYSHAEWFATKEFWNYHCCYCGKKGKGKYLTKDHVVPEHPTDPEIEKGTKRRNNIVPACSHCNSLKGNEDMETWYRKQRFFDEERLRLIYWWMAGGCYSVTIPEIQQLDFFQKGKAPKHKKQFYRNKSGKKKIIHTFNHRYCKAS